MNPDLYTLRVGSGAVDRPHGAMPLPAGHVFDVVRKPVPKKLSEAESPAPQRSFEAFEASVPFQFPSSQKLNSDDPVVMFEPGGTNS